MGAPLLISAKKNQNTADVSSVRLMKLLRAVSCCRPMTADLKAGGDANKTGCEDSKDAKFLEHLFKEVQRVNRCASPRARAPMWTL